MRYIYTSLTRISDFGQNNFTVQPQDREKWKSGDYVIGEVTRSTDGRLKAEIPTGRMVELMEGDLVMGALGVRHATLEATGTWKAIGEDGLMQLLTGAGLIGGVTSKSVFLPDLIELKYKGHVVGHHKTINMMDFLPDVPDVAFDIPVILLVGTSMSAGKTTAAKVVCRQLKNLGLQIAGAKLTGAGRYKDILAMKDAGAEHIYDFVDAGLPSTICEKETFDKALKLMLNLLAHTSADVAVIEIGASPLEPYNGDVAIEFLRKHVKCTILCASDPYAVLGVMKSFELKPTFVSGPAVNTLGGVDLIQKLCGLESLNLIKKDNMARLRALLKRQLNGE